MKWLHKVSLLSTLMNLGFAPNVFADRLCPTDGPEVTLLGNIYSSAVETLTKNKLEVSFSADGQTDAKYFRFGVSVEPVGAKGWYLQFTDSETQRVLAVVNAGTMTGRVYSSNVEVVAMLGSEAQDVKIKVRKLFEMPKTTKRTYYSWKDDGGADYKSLFAAGGDELPPVVRAKLKQQASAVAMVIVPTADTSIWQSSSCTGVMLTGDLLLTNRHCAPKTDDTFSMFCRQMVADLSWDGDDFSHEFSCKKVEFWNTEADFMIVRVAPVDGGNIGASGIPARLVANETAPIDRTVVMLHHAESKEKQVSFEGCDIANWSFLEPDPPEALDAPLSLRTFSHFCDTEGGASGAPVFTRDAAGWHVVGLHQAGYAFTPDPANPGMCKIDGVNKAIPIYWILNDIERRNPELYKEIKDNGLITSP